jgi:hypothetical protein
MRWPRDDLLEIIFEFHDPEAATDPKEQAWRTWVRLEVIQAVALAKSARSGGGSKVNKLLSALRLQLSTSKVPQEQTFQWHALMDSLT